MAYSNAVGNGTNDYLTTQITALVFITAAGVTLGTATMGYGAAAVVGVNSVATANALPVNFTWSATGTVGGFRYMAGATVLGEFIGAWATSVSGGGGIVQLSNLSAVSGGSAQVASATHSFPLKAAGEP